MNTAFLCLLYCALPVETHEVDLLIVGGSESAVAAAVQASRLGVKSIALVNDIDWLGGQFTSEGVGAVDEWTIYRSQKVPFPRSGLFAEIMEMIEADNVRKYGRARPGNSFCAWTTCEPRDTERLFRKLIAPHLKENGGPIHLWENLEPESVEVMDGRVMSVSFVRSPPSPGERSEGIRLRVKAKLTIDASDWGDVIRLSGASYLRGPDLKDRFHEPTAPGDFSQIDPNEMNPLTWCLMLREFHQPQIVPKPERYDERTFFGATNHCADDYKQLGWPAGAMKPFAPAWKDSTLPNGPYSEPPNVYTHRRLVDRRHFDLPAGTECVLVNWPIQDYPTYNFPAQVVQELEALEPGVSKKNMVDMTPTQRRVVFEDVKRHALGLLHHLQTTVASRQPMSDVTFRTLALTDEYGTADKLPKKPYLREALRLDSLYVLREQDIRDADGTQSWAAHMVGDNVFGFQFNIDFHPTRRIYLNDDAAGPWSHIHSKLRNWSTHTDRAGFPLRGLIPRDRDGLIAAGKSLGVSSIVSSAVRLHGHGMLAGQAAATVAAIALEQDVSPGHIARDGRTVRLVQSKLINSPADAPGVLMWPYQDVPVTAKHFVAVNELAVRSILVGDPGAQDFFPDRAVTKREVARAVCRASLLFGFRKDFDYERDPTMTGYDDVPFSDPDYASIESLARWHSWRRDGDFNPDDAASVRQIAVALDLLEPTTPLNETGFKGALTRAEFAVELWQALDGKTEHFDLLPPDMSVDSDGDKLPNSDDPLPFDRDNDGLTDRLDPDDDGDGYADRLMIDKIKADSRPTRRFNFTGVGSAAVPGYENDTGAAFTVARGFGWSRDISANHRRRDRHADPVRDTFLFTRETDRWECVVENGSYQVTLTLGDAAHPQPGQHATIEGTATARDVSTKAGEFHSTTATVVVTDGRLTIDIGIDQGGANTCINCVVIIRNETKDK